jgi:hypothetical protein
VNAVYPIFLELRSARIDTHLTFDFTTRPVGQLAESSR